MVCRMWQGDSRRCVLMVVTVGRRHRFMVVLKHLRARHRLRYWSTKQLGRRGIALERHSQQHQPNEHRFEHFFHKGILPWEFCAAWACVDRRPGAGDKGITPFLGYNLSIAVMPTNLPPQRLLSYDAASTHIITEPF